MDGGTFSLGLKRPAYKEQAGKKGVVVVEDVGWWVGEHPGKRSK